MSQVIENSGLPVLTAGNTVETMGSVDRDTAATSQEVENVAPEVEAPAVLSTLDTVEEFLDEENTFDVSRAEFNELRDLVLGMAHGVTEFNKCAPHKIPLVSINSVLGIK